MPNYCGNALVVKGSKKELERFKQFAKGPHRHADVDEQGKQKLLSEEKFFPYPKKFRDLDQVSHDWKKKADDYAKSLGLKEWYCGDKMTKKQRDAFIKENGEEPRDGFNQGGYEWCVKNWGSKWGNFDIDLREEKGELIYVFTTAWSPTTGLTQKMGEMFPKLKFTHSYDESGCGFKGEFIMENGKCVKDETVELITCPGCWNDMEECDCTQETILEQMKENGEDDEQIKEVKKDKHFLAKPVK